MGNVFDIIRFFHIINLFIILLFLVNGVLSYRDSPNINIVAVCSVSCFAVTVAAADAAAVCIESLENLSTQSYIVNMSR